ncbi:MAG: biotin/lipoyl-containing protein [Verrucomicrobiota bacterium]|nr:biotin/lipoyl-containing protein [Verrucomicrobiota bacterium]
MKKIKFMDTSFRDGFQSCLGARVKTKDFIPVLEAAVDAGTKSFEVGGGARFQSLYFYCQEDAFDMMDACRKAAGPNINLQSLARGVNVVGLSSQSRDVIKLHAEMFKKHGISTIRNFDALNDIDNLDWSGKCISEAGAKHQIVITMMSLPPGIKDSYSHSADFYIDKLKEILASDIPYDSVCFKDASGTSTPDTVYKTIKAAKKLLGNKVPLQFHTHCTAGVAVAAYIAAANAGVDIIDLAMDPVSGGTGQPDILTMEHAFRHTKFTLGIDMGKIIEVEELFAERLSEYFIPPEAREVSAIIPLSPMPGGALTANTQMMRDNNCLDLYPKVIKAMKEVVARGGYGTSVTPVSQFYFQQAFANVTQGPWKKMTEGYGKMLLGYFGKTPSSPDPELVKLASEELGLEPTKEKVVDINDKDSSLGIDVAKALLEKNNLEATDENLFIAAACEEKGIKYLLGDMPLGIRTKVAEEKAQFERYCKEHPEEAPKTDAKQEDTGNYTVVVDGQQYSVQVAPGDGDIKIENISSSETSAASAPTSSGVIKEIQSPIPGTVMKTLAQVGTKLSSGDTILVLEAMKMEQVVKAEFDCTVKSIEVKVGDTVSADQTVATVTV